MNSYKLKFLLFLTFQFLGFSTLKAQIEETNNIVVSSPEASSLGRYAMQPPNYSNGLPQVSVPIHTIKNGGLNYSLSLFYNSSGFSISENASSVGLGWSISEGSITRLIKHLPDENQSIKTPYGDLNNKNLVEELEGGVGQYFSQPCYTTLSKSFNYTANRIFYDLIDSKPDVYVFSFGNYSGRFLYINGQAHILPYDNLKIKKVGSSFEITTPDGNIYTFEPKEGSNTLREHEFGLSSDTYAPGSDDPNAYLTYKGTGAITNWRLVKIENSVRTKKIDFSYETNFKTDDFGHKHFTSVTFYGGNENQNSTKYKDYTRFTNPFTTYSSSALITEIKSENEIVKFIYSSRRLDMPSSKVLDSIKVYSKEDLSSPVKVFGIEHDEYFGHIGDPEKCWLKLKRVVLRDREDSEIGKYEFSYYDESSYMQHSKKGFSVDHWGYYNGKSNESLVPKTSLLNTLVALPDGPFSSMDIDNLPSFKWADREPDFQSARRYALQKITYPTKGYTVINYESAGGRGIRVASLEDNDGKSSMQKFFQYFPDEAIEAPIYKELRYTPSYCGGESDCSWSYDVPMIYTITGHGRKTLDFYDEKTNFYTKVTELNGNSDGINGKTEYYYSRESSSRKVYLLKKHIYEHGNSTPVELIENYYNPIQLDYFEYFSDPKVFWMSTTFMCDCMGDQVQHCPRDTLTALTYNLSNIDVDIFSIKQYKPNLEKTTKTINDISTTKYYTYNTKNQVVKVETKDSKGNTITQHTVYPTDFNPGSIEASAPWIVDMQDANMINKPIETYALKNGSEVLGGTHTVYNNGIDLGLPKSVYSLKKKSGLLLSSDVGQFEPSNFNGSYNLNEHYNLDYMVDGYEAGNLLQYHKDNNMDVSYLWGYNNTYPIAKVVNADYDEILFDNYEDEENPKGFRSTYDHYLRSNTMAHSGEYSLKAPSHKTYKTIITEINNTAIDTDSEYIFSAWIKCDEIESGGYVNISLKAFNSSGLSVESIVNYDVTRLGEWQLLSVKVNLAEALSSLGTIESLKCYIKNYGPGSQGLPAYYDDVRFYPSDAQMTTYTYDPLVGMTSVSDNFGRVTKYDYDDFNRLEEIRDNEDFIMEKYHYHYAE